MNMYFDPIGGLQRLQQMEADEARYGKRLVLKRQNSTGDMIYIALLVLTVVFGWILFYLPLLAVAIGGSIYELIRKTVYVKNVATGEKFYLSKDDWKAYRKVTKSKNTQTKSLSDL